MDIKEWIVALLLMYNLFAFGYNTKGHDLSYKGGYKNGK